MIEVKEAKISNYLEELKPLNKEHYEEDYRKEFSELDIDYCFFINMQEKGFIDFAVLLDEEKLIGYAICSTIEHPHNKNDSMSVIDHLYISKEYRSKGLSKLLINTLEECLRQKGSKFLAISFRDIEKGVEVSKSLGYKLIECSFGKEL